MLKIPEYNRFLYLDIFHCRNDNPTLYDGISEGTPDDYLKIYDGGTTSNQVLGLYCGSDHIVPVTSTNNEMFIVFKTDEYGSRSGFKMEYKSKGVLKTKDK